MLNLAINARDAMPIGGRLTIGTRLVEPSLHRPEIEIAVTDTGTGMSPEVLGKAFQPFFTPRRSARAPGWG